MTTLVVETNGEWLLLVSGNRDSWCEDVSDCWGWSGWSVSGGGIVVVIGDGGGEGWTSIPQSGLI